MLPAGTFVWQGYVQLQFQAVQETSLPTANIEGLGGSGPAQPAIYRPGTLASQRVWQVTRSLWRSISKPGHYSRPDFHI